LAGQIARYLQPIYTVLDRKFYFDEVYGLLLVGGVRGLMAVSYAFDKLFVDGLVNLSARVTERVSWLAGNVLDALGVDGAVNGFGVWVMTLGGLARTPQVGRIRNYILFAVGTAAVVLLIVVWPW
jgi:NADH:ubiquinone oxidoreductase subunit 5 (subunit L)/multisubunit Na+/H+ antiporter MnhA subunit